ncbi:MAG: hypothetical protein E6I35_06105 [Chloroflexi bacterium]|nr:MAG: hypothetical protein E6I41_02480 [Chloroflexota bacterium]TMF18495.1 MAG: hypothetical protein E6I35_06105 [Chloroflexota bacterium]
MATAVLEQSPSLSRDRARADVMLRGFIAAAVAARLVFWTTTNRMFEDGLTTITHARNVPLGLGLVHHAGEGNVHGFTSAIGVLIPLAGELVHQGSGMLAMRVASLIAVCIALVYARLICRDLRLGAFPTAFVLAYLAFDQNMIFYGMSGMETQVAVTVILGGVYHVRRQDLVASGIWLGLAPLARPEFVLWVAPALAYLALANLRRGIAAGGIAGAIVAPWILFTTAYYGSPIPNTVVAKAAVSPIPAILSNGSLLPWLEWLFGQVTGHIELLLYHFEPFHEVWSTAAAPLPGPVLIVIAVVVADLFAIGLVASRQVAGWWPALAFVGLFFAYRVYFIPTINYYDWYLPPFLALVMIVVAAGLQRIYVWRPMITKFLSVALAFAFAMHVPFSFGVESKVQAVENEVRTNVAEYLKATVPPGESVTSESAGYIGFYGGVKLFDYPGLTSKTSVRALQALPPDQRDLPHLVAALRPDWLVLRPWELNSLREQFPEIAAEYQVVRVFQMSGVSDAQLDADGANTISFGGLSETDVDEKFIVLRKNCATQSGC